MRLKPKHITFDCYGTLINFQMREITAQIYDERLPAATLQGLIGAFRHYRLDEVMGDWRPYDLVIKRALERACKRWNVPYRDEDGQRVYDAVPSWGPHADVPAGLARLASEFPLVILSNAADAQISHNVAKLGAPFHKVLTAQQAGAYKPRLQAFEYMLDTLGCGPQDILHCSSSFRYDLMSAQDMGIVHKAFVNRAHEPLGNAAYSFHEVKDVGDIAALVGL